MALGRPAARLLDMTAHGQPLAGSPGSIDVWIGMRPAWRVGDFTTCPIVDVSPHLGGIVTRGSKSVFINWLPAARMGDRISEAGSPIPNTILTGSPSVMIG